MEWLYGYCLSDTSNGALSVLIFTANLYRCCVQWGMECASLPEEVGLKDNKARVN